MSKKMADAIGVPVAYLYCDDEKLAALLLAASRLSKEELDDLVQSLS
jgi:hypothetical protein